MSRVHFVDAILLIVGLAVLAGAPFVGVLDIGVLDLFSGKADQAVDAVFFDLRLPRVLAGLLIGAVLAFCGVVFQALFHNPLASPFTLGISSGAAVGAAVSIVLGLSLPFSGLSSPAVFSLLGSAFTILFVFTAGRDRFGLSSTGMLLMGVVVNFFFGSLVVFLQYLSDLTQLFTLMRWLMGSLEIVGYSLMLPLALILLLALIWAVRSGIELDLIALGDELALSRGVAVRSRRLQLFALCSILIALSVTIAGPIGFVGIVIPHSCRLLFGPSHRGLLLRSAWLGGIALVLCDAIGRTVIAPAEIPVGVITALLGAPIFVLILLLRRGGQFFRQ